MDDITMNLIAVQDNESEGLDEAIQMGLEDVKNGRVTSHYIVMEEIKAKYCS